MEILFYIAAIVAIGAGVSVVFQRTPVYSALSLIVVLGALAVIYLLLDAPFIAMIQVIVYAGAIMVLFVLVIMLLNAQKEQTTHGSSFAHWLGAPLLVLFLIEFVYLIYRRFPTMTAPVPQDAGPEAIGRLLFSSYVLPFEVTSILILVAVLGAVVLAKKNL